MQRNPLRVFQSLTGRVILSLVLIAVLTSVIVSLLGNLLVWQYSQNLPAAAYVQFAQRYALLWLSGAPENQVLVNFEPMPGYTLVVSPEEQVVWTRGEAPCQVGMMLSLCAPQFAGVEVLQNSIEREEQRWAQIVMPLVTGHRLIMERGKSYGEPRLDYGVIAARGYVDVILLEAGARALFAIPIALVLGWVIVRPYLRRLAAIRDMSRRFAAGDFKARVGDHHDDDAGQLAQQINDMADVLTQNITSLRDLAQRNAELAERAEEKAIQAERLRVSRDLHDSIAQRMFALSTSTAALPGIIADDRERGIEQAGLIAQLAEQALVDLRSVLVDLRPSNVIQQGLADALKTLCNQWQALYSIEVNCSILLTGKYIPTAVQDTIYRIAQEALSNVAKHSGASQATLSLVEGQRRISLSVSDNGRGFDSNAVQISSKFGLSTMVERARAMGGTLVIEGETGRGTTIQMVLPLTGSMKGGSEI